MYAKPGIGKLKIYRSRTRIWGRRQNVSAAAENTRSGDKAAAPIRVIIQVVRQRPRPRNYGMIISIPDDLLFKSDKSLDALAVEQWHVNLEDAQQAVGHVFLTGGGSVRDP